MSPLLGTKILFLAVISVVVFQQEFSLLQSISIALCLCAVGMLSWSNGKIAWMSLLWVLLTCLGYALSDICVREVISKFLFLGLFHGSVVSACLCYSFCGLIGAGLIIIVRPVSTSMWIHALPFASTWFIAMLFLFACFGSIGIIYGSIIQSTRGILSVFLGVMVSGAGLVHLEEKMNTAELLRKAVAALCMAGAIVLYYVG